MSTSDLAKELARFYSIPIKDVLIQLDAFAARSPDKKPGTIFLQTPENRALHARLGVISKGRIFA